MPGLFDPLEQNINPMLEERARALGGDADLMDDQPRLDVDHEELMTDQVFWEERANYEEAWANIWPDSDARMIQSEEEFRQLVGPDREGMKYKQGETYEALEHAVVAHDRAAIAQSLKDNGVSAPMAEFGARALSYITTPTGAGVTALGVGVGVAMAPLYGAAAAAGEGYALLWALGKVALAETAITTSVSAAVNYVEAEHSRRKQYGAAEIGIEAGLGLLFGFIPARAAFKGAKRQIAEADAKAARELLEREAEELTRQQDEVIRDFANTLLADGWDATYGDAAKYIEVRQMFDEPIDLVREGARNQASQRGTAEAGQRAAEDLLPSLDDPNVLDTSMPNAKKVFKDLVNKDATPFEFASDVDNVLYRIGAGDDELLDTVVDRAMDGGLSGWSRESTKSRIRAAADIVTDRVDAAGKTLSRGELPDPASFNLTKATSKAVSVEGVDISFTDNLSRLVYLANQGSAAAKRGARKMLEDAGLNPQQIESLGTAVAESVADQVRQVRSRIPKSGVAVEAKHRDIPELVEALGLATKKVKNITKAAKELADQFDVSDVFGITIKDKVLRAFYTAARGDKEARAIARKVLQTADLKADEIKKLADIVARAVDANVNPKAIKNIGGKLSTKAGLPAEELQAAMPNRLPVRMKMGRVDGEDALVDVMARLDSSNLGTIVSRVRSATDEGGLAREGRTPQAAWRESDATDAIIEELPTKHRESAKAAAEEAQKKGDELLRIAASKECSLV